jgi:hypothetical protein
MQFLSADPVILSTPSDLLFLGSIWNSAGGAFSFLNPAVCRAHYAGFTGDTRMDHRSPVSINMKGDGG